MILTKLTATVINRDHLPGTWETPINPDGPEAAEFIRNMINHFGYVIKLALENIDDEQIKKEIEKHARSAIAGKDAGLPVKS
jgi:hypothetical protein